MNRSFATKSHRAPAGSLGSVFLGFLAATALAAIVVATGHGLVLAFLTYSLSGAVILLGAATAKHVFDVIASRHTPALLRRVPQGLSA